MVKGFGSETGDKVDVYWNSREEEWSIRSREKQDSRKVIFTTPFTVLLDPTFIVSVSGRQRVLRTGHKNVHAVVRGTLAGQQDSEFLWNEYRTSLQVGEFKAREIWKRVSYNPWVAGHFIQGGEWLHGEDEPWGTDLRDRYRKAAVKSADAIVFTPEGKAYARQPESLHP